jgi:hypothetical protein
MLNLLRPKKYYQSPLAQMKACDNNIGPGNLRHVVFF